MSTNSPYRPNPALLTRRVTGSVRLGQVEDDLLDRYGVRRPDLSRDASEPLGVTRRQEQRITPRGKLARIALSDATRSSGDHRKHGAAL